MNLTVDYIYGELPHFSSTLVRQAPGNRRSFLTQSVVNYLERRPDLLQPLVQNLESDEASERGSNSSLDPTSLVLLGLAIIHALQYERGLTRLRLSTGDAARLGRAQNKATDHLLKSTPINEALIDENPDEVRSLAAELRRVPGWLLWDRKVMEQRAASLSITPDAPGWLAQASLVEKFASRIDVLIGSTVRALEEILAHSVDAAHHTAPRSIMCSLCSSNGAMVKKLWGGSERLFRLGVRMSLPSFAARFHRAIVCDVLSRRRIGRLTG